MQGLHERFLSIIDAAIERKLSIYDIGRLSGKAPYLSRFAECIQKYRNHEMKITGKNALLITKAIGANPDYLISGTGKPFVTLN